MNSLFKIKHIHHLLELVLYTTDSIENLSDLKEFVKLYCNPNNESETKEICLKIIEYTMQLGAIKIYFLEGEGEYTLNNNNIHKALLVLEEDWLELQTIRKIENKDWLVEYWIEWTDEWKKELEELKFNEN